MCEGCIFAGPAGGGGGGDGAGAGLLPSPMGPVTHSLICGSGWWDGGEKRLPSDSSMGPEITLTLQAGQGKALQADQGKALQAWGPNTSLCRGPYGDGRDQWSLMKCLCPTRLASSAHGPSSEGLSDPCILPAPLTLFQRRLGWFSPQKGQSWGQPADTLKLT